MAKNPAQTTMKDKYINFAVRLSKIHMEAHAIGLHETGHALCVAVQKVGYEIGYLREKAK